jgi:hypothetical protein
LWDTAMWQKSQRPLHVQGDAGQKDRCQINGYLHELCHTSQIERLLFQKFCHAAQNSVLCKQTLRNQSRHLLCGWAKLENCICKWKFHPSSCPYLNT